MKRTVCCLLALCTLLLTACSSAETNDAEDGATVIELSDSGITVNGEAAPMDESAAVYTAHDIVFYLEGQDFTYGEGTAADEHSQKEADAHTVVHITQPGSYAVSGALSAGQIAVDLGEDAEEDPAQVVTLILNGVDLTCTVAPAVIFYNVYECGSADEADASMTVDTSAAGANVIIADGTENHISGSYVARIYQPGSVELREDGSAVTNSKKLHKYDGAFYSKMSMNVDGGTEGTGVLTIDAENEGLDSELHLTINGGKIRINSGNDGINTNEDGISVTTINGGTIDISVNGATGEGDGIDSNGWLVINGGTVTAASCGDSQDAGIDSDNGIYINGGTVAVSGNMLDRIAGGTQPYVVFSFAQRQTGGTTYTLKSDTEETVGEWSPGNDFSTLIVSSPDLTAGTYTLWQGTVQLAGTEGGAGGPGMMGGGRPEGMMPPERQEMPKEDFGQHSEKDRPQPNEDGTVTDPPELARPKDGQRSELSQGVRPDGMETAETSTDFVLTAEGGTFGNISAAK